MKRLLVLAALAACQKDSTGAPAPKKSKAGMSAPRDASPNWKALDGKALYVGLCAQCHGVDRKGYIADHAPSLASRTFLESASDDFLRRSIYSGRPGTAMAGYGTGVGGPLDEPALARLIAYLRTDGPPQVALTAPGKGDAANGAAIYAKHCQACHGDQKTRGEGVSLGNSQFLASATDSFVRYAIANGRTDTKMVAWLGQLTDAQIDDVVAAVRKLGAVTVPEVTLLPEPTGKEPVVVNPKGKQADFALKDDKYIGVDAVSKALADGRRIVVIDARPPSDWRRVHVAGAVSIPYHDLKRLDEMPTDGTWIVAYCACPHHLSGIVIDELRKRGFKHTAVLDEGILEWHRRGYAVVAAQGVTAPPKEPPLPPGTLR